MKNKYKLYNTLNIVFLAISLLLVIVDKFFEIPKIWLLTISLWGAIISYILALIMFFIKNLMYIELEAEYPIEAYKFAQEYYDKVGYSLFTGGIIVLFTTSEFISSLGLTIIGITCIIISINKKIIPKKFEDKLKNIKK